MCWTLFFMGEAWFYLSGYINCQNSRIWSAENPHALHVNPLHLSKIGCSVCSVLETNCAPLFFFFSSSSSSAF
jgi:hypothetical protein